MSIITKLKYIVAKWREKDKKEKKNLIKFMTNLEVYS